MRQHLAAMLNFAAAAMTAPVLGSTLPRCYPAMQPPLEERTPQLISDVSGIGLILVEGARMAKAEAAVFVGPGKRFEFREFPLPQIEARGILVRVKIASICGTDLHIYHGARKPPLPIIPGHEAMGVIDSLGKDVRTDSAGEVLREGDRVTWSYSWACGSCYFCSVLKESVSCLNRIAYGVGLGCTDPPHLNGSFSEFIYLRPGTSVFKVPNTLTDEIAATANCALVTMVHVTDRVSVGLNQNVVVQGFGPLGLYGAVLARERGAGQIIAVGHGEQRLKVAGDFGVDETINAEGMSDDQLVEEVREMTGGIGADVVIEATGAPQALAVGLRLPREGGTYATIGPVYQGATVSLDCFNLIFRRISLVGVARNEASQLKEAIRFLERTRTKYPYEKVVGAKFPLRDIENAFQTAGERRVMRAAVTP